MSETINAARKADRRENIKGRQVLGAVLASAGGMCWGLSGSMGQYMFRNEGMDSRWLVPYRLGLAGIIMFLYCLFSHRKKLFDVFRTAQSARQILIYSFGVCSCQFLYFQTIQWSSASAATILQDISPIFVLMWTCMTAERRPRFREVLAIILALCGVFLITTHGQIQSAPVPCRAILTGLGCAVCVTIYNEVPGEFLARYPVVVLQSWAFLLGGGVLYLAFHPWTSSYVPSPAGLFGIAFVVVVGNVLAFTLYMGGVAIIGPDKAILYGFMEPVTAAVITFTVFGSRFTVYDALGFAAVFAMLALISAHSSAKENNNN